MKYRPQFFVFDAMNLFFFLDVFFSGTGPYEAEYKELKKQEEKFVS